LTESDTDRRNVRAQLNDVTVELRSSALQSVARPVLPAPIVEIDGHYHTR
jgi:hypothetical protein